MAVENLTNFGVGVVVEDAKEAGRFRRLVSIDVRVGDTGEFLEDLIAIIAPSPDRVKNCDIIGPRVFQNKFAIHANEWESKLTCIR